MRRILIAILAAWMGGCAPSRALPPTLSVGPGRYAEAFDAAREVLRAARFEIDRVDAAAGAISTEPKRSSGLAMPWDRDQSSFGQEIEDLVNHQQRVVRVTFEPEGSGAPGGGGQVGEGPAAADLRGHEGPMVARVHVVIERERRPGWRVESVSIGSSSFTRDPALGPRGMLGSYWVPVARDPGLEGRIAARIAERLRGAGPPADGVRPASPTGG